VYAAGYVAGGTFGFGNNVSAVGINASYNLLLVKYNSLGTAQWAQTVSPATAASKFYAVAVDAWSDIYAGGYLYNGTFGFGGGLTATITAPTDCWVLLKYQP
jgi:hypothetical protein